MNSILQYTHRSTLIVSLIAAVILGNSAFNDNQILAQKVEGQQSALNQINRWKAEYDALKPFQAKWDKTLAPTSQITDLYHIYIALDIERHGLKTDQELLIVYKIEPITLNGTPIHASRVCLKSIGDTGLAITAPHFSPDLLNGLKQLAERRDVEINNIQLGTQHNVPKATLDICLVFRA